MTSGSSAAMAWRTADAFRASLSNVSTIRSRESSR
jgi:hypothetical protein